MANHKPFEHFRTLTEDTKPEDSRITAIKQELMGLLKVATEKNLIARIRLMGLSPSCSRCGGSGHYSFNLMHGTVCYGCAGVGYMQPTSIKGWQFTLDNAKRAVAAGKLDEYTERLAARKRVEQAIKTAMNDWTASGISKKYDWNRAVDCSRRIAHVIEPNQWVDVKSESIPVEPPADKPWWKPFTKELLLHDLYSDINSYFATHHDVQTDSMEIMQSVLTQKNKQAPERREEHAQLLDEFDKHVLPAIKQHQEKLKSLIGRVPSIADAFMSGAITLRYKEKRYHSNSEGVLQAGWIEDRIGSVPNVIKAWQKKMVTQYKAQMKKYDEDE